MNTTRRALLGALLAAPAIARAQDGYPVRPIRYVCPYPPGATNDNVSRTMSRALQQRLGVTLVVENRAGAGGTVGARFVAESRPDGYTLLNASAGNLTIAPHLNQVGYDPLRSFAPIASAGEAYSIVAINPALPVRTLPELLDYARTHRGELNYASAGIGSAGHLRGALLMDAAGAEAVHVPFPGSAAAVNSVLAGDCHLILDPIAAPNVLSGGLVGIATIGEDRWDAFPDLSTVAEYGVGANWPSGGWYGLLAPAGTPAEIVATLNQVFNESLAEPQVSAALRRLGIA